MSSCPGQLFISAIKSENHHEEDGEIEKVGLKTDSACPSSPDLGLNLHYYMYYSWIEQACQFYTLRQ